MTNNNLTIIIPAAGPCRKMRNFAPKSLIQLDGDGRSVIQRQLDILRELWPKADFIVVVGYEGDKLARSLPSWVRVIENPNFEETSVTKSIGIGLRATISNKVLIVFGDIVFTKKTIQEVVNKESAILTQKKNLCESFAEEPGVVISKNQITHIDFGLDQKWSKVIYLTGKPLQLFKHLSNRQDKKKHLPFELLNEIIDAGHNLTPISNKDKPIISLNSIQDIKKANKL